ncbi:dermonecrotic toxin domain-containing protein [Pseudomonas sp. NPDC008258]|uniref:dermonecrotic toxin domain-containing protein n=1 Tax=Pseudomonas sp. NPDC008258 TaxID=3364418 RepID=UPI0036E296AF
MNELEQHLRQNLQALGAGRTLAKVMDDFLCAYPDLDESLQRQARMILRKHCARPIEPRYVWWHQFHSASSSPRSFTGWQHNGPPLKSIRLTELVATRFDLHFQEAGDELDVYGGFYRQGRNARYYDEHNELPLLGRQVQQDLWTLDFATLYRSEVEQFWREHGERFQLLAKVNLLGQGTKAAAAGHISADDLDWLKASLLGASSAPLTLERLSQGSPACMRGASAYRFASSRKPCFYNLREQGGRVLLYLPWAAQPLHGFASPNAMAQWLQGQLQSAGSRSLYTAGALSGQQEQSRTDAVEQLLLAIAHSASSHAALQHLEASRSSVGQDLFLHMAELAQHEMRENAALLLDNSTLRKAMWGGYLSAFVKVFAGFTPLGWPVSLALLGASVAMVGLDVDTAVHARSGQARKAALRAAMLDTLFAALNMADVAAGSSFASLAYRAPPHELDAAVGQWQPAERTLEPLNGLEGNRLLVNEPEGSGALQGIRISEDGSCWIEIDDMPYRVRYSHELEHWLIVPPDNPFAFGEPRPVRQNEQGEWALLQRPRLAGGSPPGPAAAIPEEQSQFWDEYMRTNETRSEAMSDQAEERNKKLLDDAFVPSLDPDAIADSDGEEYDCVRIDGTTHYTYEQGGEYYNHLIRTYSEEDTQINRPLREGKPSSGYSDDTDFISKLADDLESLPRDNAVPIYRGGHGTRGTSGAHFRSGRLKVGDTLVNTDFTSFTENPYIVRRFAADNDQVSPQGHNGVFDDSSVVFELPAKQYYSGTPISTLSGAVEEAETLFTPGHYFRIEQLTQVRGVDFHFVKVRMSQVDQPAGPVYDLRTGEPFDRATYLALVKNPILVDRFFPIT